MKKIIILMFGLVFYGLNAQKTTSMPFLLINPDARAGGMGDIGVGTSSDAFSIYHNPAKTAFNKSKMSLGVNYTPWLRNLTDDIFVGGFSFINRFDERQAFGVDLKYFSLGKIGLSNELGVNTGTENPSELSFEGVYAMKLSDQFSMGVGMKYINSNYKINSADTNLKAVNTFAIDVSGFYQSQEQNYGSFNGVYRFGFNIANIGPKVSYSEGVENFIPTNFKLGGGFDFIIDNSNSIGSNLEFTKLLVPNATSEKSSMEGIFRAVGEPGITWALGAEYKYKSAFSVRTGYFYEGEDYGNRKFLTMGAGFKARSFSLDLSYLMNTSTINNPLENTLRFSLSFDFGDVFDRE